MGKHIMLVYVFYYLSVSTLISSDNFNLKRPEWLGISHNVMLGFARTSQGSQQSWMFC